MSCNNCTPVTLNACTQTLVLGLSPDPMENYYLKIEDITNSRLVLLNVDNDGTNISVDLSEFHWATNHSYEISLVTTSDITTQVSWYCSETNYTCLQVKFEKHYDENKQLIWTTSDTIC